MVKIAPMTRRYNQRWLPTTNRLKNNIRAVRTANHQDRANPAAIQIAQLIVNQKGTSTSMVLDQRISPVARQTVLVSLAATPIAMAIVNP